MKTVGACFIAALCLVGFQGTPKSVEDRITFNAEIGSIESVIKSLSQSSGIKMQVTGPATRDTVYLHIEDRPVSEVMDRLASAVHGTWTKGTDDTYTLTRSYKFPVDPKADRSPVLIKDFKKWLDDGKPGVEVSYTYENLVRLIKERKQLAKKDSEKMTDKEHERYNFLERISPTSRALYRLLQNLNIQKYASAVQDDTVIFATNPNASQQPLPPGGSEAMAKLSGEVALWAKAMQSLPSLEKDEDSNSVQEESAYETEGRFGRIYSTIWTRKRPLPGPPAQVLLKLDKQFGSFVNATLQVFDREGNRLISESDILSYDEERDSMSRHEDPPPVKVDVRPNKVTTALWSLHDQTEDYKEVKPPAESYQILDPYFADPVTNDPLKIGNQEILDAIASREHCSVVACLPDRTLASLTKEFSTEKFLRGHPADDMRSRRSTGWIECFPDDYEDHWHHYLDRKAMKTFSSAYRGTGHADLSLYVPLECGELGYPSSPYTEGFIQEIIRKGDRYATPSQSSYNHLFLSLTNEQWMRLRHGEVIPYRELTPDQLSLVSEIASNFDYGYIGGEPPDNFGKRDLSYELPNGILSGGGLGAEFSDDDVFVVHYTRTEPGEDPYVAFHNIAERKEKFKDLPSWCGMRSYIPMDSLFEFRKQKRVSLRVYLAGNHYYVGDFMEPVPKVENGRKYRYSELSPATIKRVPEQFLDDSDRRGTGTPPP